MSNEKRPPGVMLYYDKIRPILALLTDEERGKLLVAVLDYGESGFEPCLDKRLSAVWPFIREMVDRDVDAYRAKCEKAARAIQTRWAREKGQAQSADGN